jgi:flagellar motor switch protein FliG
MSLSADSLRKAAIVLASLDADTADALIDRMPVERAGAVRQMLMELDQIDSEEQAAVVDEFLRRGESVKQADAAGVEVEASLAEKLNLDAPTFPDPAPTEHQHKPAAPTDLVPLAVADAGPFDFLQLLGIDELAAHLEHERPQILAVILGFLPAQRAADLLSCWPSTVQADVLRRVDQLGPLDPGMIGEIERGLRQRLAGQAALPRPPRRGATAVASILEAAGQQTRASLMNSLATHAPDLADRFGPPSSREPELGFDDLAQLPELALAKIFAACDSEVLMLALAGAHPSFARRVLDQLPTRDAKQLRRRLDGLGPTRLSDVERAQHEVTAVARRLHIEGRIELSRARPWSLTV